MRPPYIEQCKNCFHRSTDENYPWKHKSYCNKLKKRLFKIIGVKCKHYLNENYYKSWNDE